MPIAGLFIIFNIGIYETQLPWEIQKYTYLIVGLFSILLPLSVLPVFMYFKLVDNVELSKRKERSLPLAVTATCLIILHIFLSRVVPLRIINSFTLAIAVLSIFLLFINIFYKISMHLIALGGIAGLLLATSVEYSIYPFTLLAVVFMVSGIVATSRIQLKEHNLGQSLSGFLLGSVTVFTLITVSI